MTTEMMTTETIDSSELQRLLNEDVHLRILDVRTGGEFETVHIPGSYNVPLDTLHEHASDLADVERPVVLVCQSGARAGTAHERLSNEGKRNLRILDGGMTAWMSTGGDVIQSASPRWAMDRQVRFVAGSLVLTAVLASVLSPKAKWAAAGVGAGLFYSAVSNTCAMASLLAKLPYNKGQSCDVAAVIQDLNQKDSNQQDLRELS